MAPWWFALTLSNPRARMKSRRLGRAAGSAARAEQVGPGVSAIILEGKRDAPRFFIECARDDGHRALDGFALGFDRRVALESGIQVVAERGLVHDAEELELFVERGRAGGGGEQRVERTSGRCLFFKAANQRALGLVVHTAVRVVRRLALAVRCLAD